MASTSQCALSLLLLLAAGAAAAGQNYAVIVAGSSGYDNYRHQSDACHAFHVLTDHGGIPKENIIVFMYDDIAYNVQNPVKGQLINHPNGSNVYPGVNKDYTGAAVTPANFLAVLAGNASAVVGGSGRVLPSGPQDNVFIYFTDHGATGLIAFPSDYLYADQLMPVLKGMHKRKYASLVFYLESCESGSMFDGLLPADINIFATTAATPDESSYACYYDDERQTYLGDEYSVRWMEDSDKQDQKKSAYSLESQFKLVVSETLQSTPQQYGELSISTDPIAFFQAAGAFSKGARRMHKRGPAPAYTPCGDPVDSRDVKLHRLLRRRAAARDAQSRAELDADVQRELVHRARSDFIANQVVDRVTRGTGRPVRAKLTPELLPCLRASVAAFESVEGRFTDYSLKHVRLLLDVCAHMHPGVGAEKLAGMVASAAREAAVLMA